MTYMATSLLISHWGDVRWGVEEAVLGQISKQIGKGGRRWVIIGDRGGGVGG